jgi:uncharacterized protein (TIGR03083 family)
MARPAVQKVTDDPVVPDYTEGAGPDRSAAGRVSVLPSGLADGPRTLLAAVGDIGADTTVATFLGPRPASWWVRRRLHEATIHRADAALALRTEYTLATDLAADGISEWLDRLVADRSTERPAALPAGARLVLHAADRAAGWAVRGTADGIAWTDATAEGDVRLEGRAAELLLALVRRKPLADTGIRLDGDSRLWHAWLESTPL